MPTLTYRESGVDVAAAEALIEDYKALAGTTETSQVITGVGGFAGLFSLSPGYKKPVLVACTDGVGTKLRLLIEHGLSRTAGKDAAAMCLNDLATSGARPLFMLDYLAVGKLQRSVLREVVAGFADYCRQAGCALLGGETAEMPGFYPPGDYDVAGFAIGVVEEADIIDGSRCQEGDILLGLASTGVHSNGFSLVRLLLERRLICLDTDCGDVSLGEALLQPTCLYLPLAQELAALPGLKAMAHITGGGLPGNVGRTVPPAYDVIIEGKSWPQPPVFTALMKAGVSRQEMLDTFNLGIGYTVVISEGQVEKAVTLCHQSGVEAWKIGYLARGSGGVIVND